MKKYSITMKHTAENGTTWIVSLYVKGFLFKKRVETKWFNSGETAEAYIAQLKYTYVINNEARHDRAS
ncbi:MAG: hypothetical protein PHP42_11370 [Bacteroidota bacterium]|nr:hypothetical protein [Bacteroidota bacterium]